MKKISLAIMLCASFTSTALAGQYTTAAAAAEGGRSAGSFMGEMTAKLVVCQWPTEKIEHFRTRLADMGRALGAGAGTYGAEYAAAFIKALPEGEARKQAEFDDDLVDLPKEEAAKIASGLSEACEPLNASVATLLKNIERLEARSRASR